MSDKNPILKSFPIEFQWQTTDPFLFCAYHYDLYPKANDQYGPADSLAGRNIGQDFEPKNGYRMYHGDKVPGFPVHPHRGFETITLVRKGFVDHADSLGAAGRYSSGDVQWMTAGRGIQHSEMFPLLNRDSDNHLELLQVWINLPKKSKMVEPDYKMLWSEQIPRVFTDTGKVSVDIIAGKFRDTEAPLPPDNSWASDPKNNVAVWVIEMQPNATVTLPVPDGDFKRTLYFYDGEKLSINHHIMDVNMAAEVSPNMETSLENHSEKNVKILVLQGRPINEPVAQHGPFVMNTKSEIVQAFREYQTTQFGGWTWEQQDMVHGPDKKRFGKHANGKIEYPG